MEIVVQQDAINGSTVNRASFYHGCPGPFGNKSARYNDSTTADGNPSCGNIRRQHVEGWGGEMCCHSGNQTDCVTFPANQWVRHWMHVTVGPSWAAADDRVQMYIKRPSDPARILVFDTNISKNFGDEFAGRINNCGTCSNNPTVGCMVDADCPGGTCANREFGCAGGTTASGSGKYGRIWVNSYTAQKVGTPTSGEIAYTWMDNLLITTTDPEGGGGGPAACGDGVDNDGDGATDYPADTGCEVGAGGANDTSERGSIVCDNNADDDGDGLIDYPADPGCTSIGDADEVNAPPPAPTWVGLSSVNGGSSR